MKEIIKKIVECAENSTDWGWNDEEEEVESFSITMFERNLELMFNEPEIKELLKTIK